MLIGCLTAHSQQQWARPQVFPISPCFWLTKILYVHWRCVMERLELPVGAETKGPLGVGSIRQGRDTCPSCHHWILGAHTMPVPHSLHNYCGIRRWKKKVLNLGFRWASWGPWTCEMVGTLQGSRLYEGLWLKTSSVGALMPFTDGFTKLIKSLSCRPFQSL